MMPFETASLELTSTAGRSEEQPRNFDQVLNGNSELETFMDDNGDGKYDDPNIFTEHSTLEARPLPAWLEPLNNSGCRYYYCGSRYWKNVILAISFVTGLLLGIRSTRRPVGWVSRSDSNKYGNPEQGDFLSYQFGGALEPGYFSSQESILITPPLESQGESIRAYRFGFLTDLDKLSRIDTKKSKRKPHFVSYLIPGLLYAHNPVTPSQSQQQDKQTRYTITWDADVGVEGRARPMQTNHNEAGRGGEFSDLILYQDRLFTVDDRTGILFEIGNTCSGEESFVIPRYIFAEGPGRADKGMKWEWATVKDDHLYLGSNGRVSVEDQDIQGRNDTSREWVVILDNQGRIRRENWSHVYDLIRKSLHVEFPGYVIIEAVRWSESLHQWVILPRRISEDRYDKVTNERRGGHVLVYVSENFQHAKILDLQVGSKSSLKGFSAFSFIPGSSDTHILAIRTIEEDCAADDDHLQCQQRSYLICLDIVSGEQLSDEVEYLNPWKCEGIEFFNPFVTPPLCVETIFDDSI